MYLPLGSKESMEEQILVVVPIYRNVVFFILAIQKDIFVGHHPTTHGKSPSLL